jgi:hypothetical protein
LLIACLSALAIASVYAIVHATHRRLPESEPLHGDHRDFARSVPLHVAEADSMTAREVEEERAHRDGAAVSRDR